MKILGLLVCVLGWLIAVMSVKVPGVYVQLFVALAGFIVAAIGALAILNRAHLLARGYCRRHSRSPKLRRLRQPPLRRHRRNR